jgi:hypothetical protein
MAVQKDQKLPLGRINRLTGPAARQPDELEETRLEGVRRTQPAPGAGVVRVAVRKGLIK